MPSPNCRTRTILTPLLLLISAMGNSLAQATFHGDNTRSGVYETAGPERLKGVKWSVKTGGPIVGSPAVVDGTVYIGSMNGYLYALDEESGKEKWKFKSRMPVSSSPAVAGGSLFYVTGTGALVALDVNSGKPTWIFSTELERRFEARNLHGQGPAGQTIPDAWDLWTSSPAVFEGKVYFGSGDGNVYAVDARTGAMIWKFPTRDVVHASPAVANNTVVVGSWDGSLYGLEADTGRLKWTFNGGEDPVMHNQQGFQSSPAVVDGVVYVGCRDAHLYALDLATGRKRWDYPTNKSWVIGTPAVRDGMVYVGTSDSSRFMGIDSHTGRLRFDFPAKAFVFSSAALAGKLAYVGDFDGRFYAIDTKTGQLAWEFRTPASEADPFKILNADGSLNDSAFAPFFGDFEDMYIQFYRLASIGAIVSSAVVDHGTVFFGSMDGFVYALN